jgi:hypothetical protein
LRAKVAVILNAEKTPFISSPAACIEIGSMRTLFADPANRTLSPESGSSACLRPLRNNFVFVMPPCPGIYQ